jgi:poly(glycerol-phosphate) alpha-glucosyltransferase
MARALVDWAPDLVHTHGIWMHPSRSVLQWHHYTGKPHIVSPHGMLDSWAVQNSGLKKRVAGILYEHRHLNQAAALHALCDSEAAAFEAYGLSNYIQVIPNGIDVPPDKAFPKAPWRNDFPSSARVMLFLGRLHPKKNILSFLEAWAAARSKVGKWRLVIAGWDDGGHAASISTAIRELHLEQEVKLVGPLFGNDKEAAFRNADAFVLPSLSEGLPMTVLEACSYGVPVLMTDACNLKEAFSVDAARRLDIDPVRMVLDLAAFLALSPDEAKGIGARGRGWVQRAFNWASTARRMADLYRQVVRNGKCSIADSATRGRL